MSNPTIITQINPRTNWVLTTNFLTSKCYARLIIVAINAIRRFTSKKTQEIVQPYDHSTTETYLIKGTETVYTSTKNVFQGQEKMRFFGFRFMSIWVFPMAITGAFMEFLFVGPLKGTNPFG